MFIGDRLLRAKSVESGQNSEAPKFTQRLPCLRYG